MRYVAATPDGHVWRRIDMQRCDWFAPLTVAHTEADDSPPEAQPCVSVTPARDAPAA